MFMKTAETLATLCNFTKHTSNCQHKFTNCQYNAHNKYVEHEFANAVSGPPDKSLIRLVRKVQIKIKETENKDTSSTAVVPDVGETN